MLTSIRRLRTARAVPAGDAARNPDDRRPLFATAVWLRAAPDGRITFASSGHNPMLLFRAAGAVEDLKATGPPAGMFEDQIFEDRTFELAENDVLCLYTDGLVEAEAPNHEEFGRQRLAEIGRAGHRSLMDLTRAVYRAVGQHRDSSLLDDDLTYMVVERSLGS